MTPPRAIHGSIHKHLQLATVSYPATNQPWATYTHSHSAELVKPLPLSDENSLSVFGW